MASGRQRRMRRKGSSKPPVDGVVSEIRAVRCWRSLRSNRARRRINRVAGKNYRRPRQVNFVRPREFGQLLQSVAPLPPQGDQDAAFWAVAAGVARISSDGDAQDCAPISRVCSFPERTAEHGGTDGSYNGRYDGADDLRHQHGDNRTAIILAKEG